MRILMVTQFFSPIVGGEERAVEELSRELVRRGHDVAVATLASADLPDREEIGGVRVHRIPSATARLPGLYQGDGRRHAPPVADPEASLALGRVLAAERPDVVHAHNWLGRSLQPLRRRLRSPLVVSLHDYSRVCATKRLFYEDAVCSGPGPVKCVRCAAEHYGGAKGAAIATLNAVAAAVERRLVDRYLPVSEYVAHATGLVDAKLPYRVVPNFVPDELPEAPAGEEERLAGLPDGDFVLYAGDATEDKGAGVLLDVHATLRDARPLVLIGRPLLPRLAEAPPNVHVLGPWPHDALLDAFRRCTVAVVPSLCPEAFGLTALEAMALGRPLIASRVGGLAELVGGDGGVLVTPGDRDELRSALARVLADARLRDELGRAAHRRSLEFRASRIVPRVEAVYREVVSATSSPAGTTRPGSGDG